jgi:hypothetical protein
MKTEIRKEQCKLYVNTYFCRYCSFNSETKPDIETHITTHWLLRKISPGKDYYNGYIVQIKEKDREIYICDKCDLIGSDYYDMLDHEIDHLPNKCDTDGITFFHCNTEAATKLFEDGNGELGEWYYWDEDFGFRPLTYKILKLENQISELKKIRDEI